MPELEPITREEKLLDGQNLEPVTRREKFIKKIYDKTQTIPEPVTREEIFLKKAGESGGDITIKELTATENGDYSEEDTAYSPVHVAVPQPTLSTLEVSENGDYDAPSGTAYNRVEVDVPLPRNAYLLKSVANLPQAIASFNDGQEMVMPSLKVAIEPQQEGSGDPSPTNIRPISGWDEVNLTVADDVETPTVSNVYTIDLDGTRYGGEVDVVSGIMTVDRAIVDMGDLNWFYTSDAKLFTASIQGIKSGVYTDTNLISSIYPVKPKSYSQFDYGMRYNSATAIGVKNPLYTDAQAFKTAMSGVQLVYELATPLTIQLTPTQVKSLLGSNNVWADTGDITDAEYFSKEV